VLIDLNRIKEKPYIEERDCDGTKDEEDAIDAWKNYLRRNKSLIVDVFQGQLRSELQCLTCKHKNVRFETFMYLSLPISSDCRDIRDCLALFLEDELLQGANKWYCSKCKKHRTATKKTDLWILPPVLIVHLKRFTVTSRGRIGLKNSASINYPVRGWNLSKHIRSTGSELPMYDLYAVSNHVGSLGSGHYTAFALNRFTEKWHEFNDSNCREISENTLRGNRSSAYVLFYNRSSEDRASVSVEQRAPMIRRQSVSRPDLWPHTQVQDRASFREFKRSRSRLLPVAPFPGGKPKASARKIGKHEV